MRALVFGDLPDPAAPGPLPQVLGHEVVEVGPEARGVERGQRVLLQCWDFLTRRLLARPDRIGAIKVAFDYR